MESKRIPYDKINKMIDGFMQTARSKRFWPHLEGHGREGQLKRLEATMRGSILKNRPDILEYSIKYVRKNW